MKSVVQNIKTGEVAVIEVPALRAGPGQVLVRNRASLVSAGTERMLMHFGEKNLIGKAMARPDLVRQVLDKAKREGILSTLDSVRSKLNKPIPLGYSCSGTVIVVGERVESFQPNDRVACAGGGYAVHAEVISVPENLVVKLPGELDFESGAFVTLGSIAMHGLRLARPQVGETVAVIGLGLVGNIVAQLASASGCRVVGTDLDQERCSLAEGLGCDVALTGESEFIDIIFKLTGEYGADKVVVCAATPSSGPIELAARVARDRATVVVVGDVGMDIPRRMFFEKELDLHVSRSYGPGRYDSSYEEKGNDYPIGYVRWTENRNMQAFLQLAAQRKVDIDSLITHRYPIHEAESAYDLISGKREEPSLAVLITYEEEADLCSRIELAPRDEGPKVRTEQVVTVGMFGAGSFATSTLLPAMKKVKDVELAGICTATGLSAQNIGERFGFRYCATDESEILRDDDVNTVVIATRHNLHAKQVVDALKAGKNVFCEKPLALNEDELRSIVKAYSVDGPNLMVGFNRRFSGMARRAKRFLDDTRDPLVMHYRVNAGFIPEDHWVHDAEQGGGRIVGEICHFVDFATFLSGGSLPVSVEGHALPNGGRYHNDNVVVTLRFSDGSLATITYVANGDAAFPKERIEVFGGGAVVVIDDYRRVELTRGGRRRVFKSRLRQDKGHVDEWEAFASTIKNGIVSPIPFKELVSTTLVTFGIGESLRKGGPVDIDAASFIAEVVDGS